MTPTEAAWLAGILEGEGYFKPSGRSPEVSVEMTDQDVIERAATLMGGCVKDRPIRGEHRPAWRVRVYGPRAIAVMIEVLPHMGSRRSARILDVIGDFYRSEDR